MVSCEHVNVVVIPWEAILLSAALASFGGTLLYVLVLIGGQRLLSVASLLVV